MSPVDFVRLCQDTSCPVLILIIRALYARDENTGNSLYTYYPMQCGKISYRHMLKPSKHSL